MLWVKIYFPNVDLPPNWPALSVAPKHFGKVYSIQAYKDLKCQICQRQRVISNQQSKYILELLQRSSWRGDNWKVLLCVCEQCAVTEDVVHSSSSCSGVFAPSDRRQETRDSIYNILELLQRRQLESVCAQCAVTEDVGGETSLSLGEDSKQSIVCLASFAAVGDRVVLVVTQ